MNLHPSGIDAAKLTDTALEMLIDELERRGNVISPLHRVALLDLVSTFSTYAIGEASGRRALSLNTGLGKTTAVVQWIAASHRLGYLIPVSVAAARVEALCEMKRDLIKAGVPGSLIGLTHSYMYPSEASEPSTGREESYLVQLVSHTRVRGPSDPSARRADDFDLYGKWNDQPRPLLIFDEALLRGNGRAVHHRAVRMAVAAFSESGSIDVPIVRQAFEFMRECRDVAQATLDDLKKSGDPEDRGAVVAYPYRDPAQVRAYERALEGAINGESLEVLVSLLHICQGTVRVLVTSEGAGILWASVAVPPELANVCILDASDPIRELIRLDPTIVSASTFPQIKTFERVSITQLLAGGGRSMMTKRVQADEKKACRDFVDIIKSEWETSKGVLIFTVKPRRGLDLARTLRGQLQDASLDINAKVLVDGVLRDKLIWKTFGATEGENGMEYADVVLCAGTMYRSHLDLASAVQAQTLDPRYPMPHDLISSLVESEAASLLFQAASRGSCRRVCNGSAEPMRFYFVHRNKSIRTLLERVMPDASWTTKEPEHLKKPKPIGLVDRMAALILDHLNKVDAEVPTVSSKDLKRALSLAPDDQASKSLYGRAAKLICSRSDSGWYMVGRGLSRKDAGYFFNP